MIAVIYDPATGIISNTMQATEETIAKNGAYVVVKEWRMDYDSLYEVKNGKLVPKSAAAIAEAALPPTAS